MLAAISWITGIGIAASIVGLLGFLFAAFRVAQTVWRVIEALDTKTDISHKELTANGGDSVRDRIVALDAQFLDQKRLTEREFAQMHRMLRLLFRHLKMEAADETDL